MCCGEKDEKGRRYMDVGLFEEEGDDDPAGYVHLFEDGSFKSH